MLYVVILYIFRLGSLMLLPFTHDPLWNIFKFFLYGSHLVLCNSSNVVNLTPLVLDFHNTLVSLLKQQDERLSTLSLI